MQTPDNQTPPQAPNSNIPVSDLIQGTQHTAPGEFQVGGNFGKNKQDSVSVAQEMRFFLVRYKVYSFIAIVILLFIASPVQSALQFTRDKRKSLDTIKDQITIVKANQKRYEDEKKLFEEITTQKDKIISCVNQSNACDELSENIKKNLEAIKAYIQLGNLYRPKMDVDESKILKNINEYMLQKSIVGQERSYNGLVTSISIGTTETNENNIMKVPVSLLVSFERKEDLLSFLNNIENYIYTEQNNDLDATILSRIEELKYDIVNYKESQDVEVSLSAYAYQGK